MPHKGEAPDLDSDETYLRIGELAEQLGVTQRTLRFWEEKGLLGPPSRMESGFRLYGPDDVARATRIRRLQQLLGFPLADIKEMVEAEEVKLQLKSEYRQDAETEEKLAQVRKAIEVTERQYSLIQQKVNAMTEMKAKLEERLERFRSWEKQLNEAKEPASASSAG